MLGIDQFNRCLRLQNANLFSNLPPLLLQIVEGLRRGFNTRKTYEKEYRRTQLKQLKLFLEEHEEDAMDALKQDLSKVFVPSIVNSLQSSCIASFTFTLWSLLRM